MFGVGVIGTLLRCDTSYGVGAVVGMIEADAEVVMFGFGVIGTLLRCDASYGVGAVVGAIEANAKVAIERSPE